MARPVTIKTEHILEVARKLFLEHGYGCSTARIARELEISEGTLYKRFSTKECLFGECMEMPRVEFADEWPSRAGTGEPRELLFGMATELVAFFREILPRMMMMWQSPGPSPLEIHKESGAVPPPVRIMRNLTLYLEAERDAQRLAVREPAIVARMVLGSIHNFVFFEIMGFEFDDKDEATVVAGVVDTLLRGMV